MIQIVTSFGLGYYKIKVKFFNVKMNEYQN